MAPIIYIRCSVAGNDMEVNDIIFFSKYFSIALLLTLENN